VKADRPLAPLVIRQIQNNTKCHLFLPPNPLDFNRDNSILYRMNAPFLEPHLAEIQHLCRVNGVERLDVFGSVLRDDFSTASDVDFLVVFQRDDATNAFNQYFDFKEALQQLLGREVELVCVNAIRNPHFKREVEQTKQPLYAA
jgi:predicted nucleotidyltransferase